MEEGKPEGAKDYSSARDISAGGDGKTRPSSSRPDSTSSGSAPGSPADSASGQQEDSGSNKFGPLPTDADGIKDAALKKATEKADERNAKPSEDAAEPNAKGKAINTGIQALGTAAGNVAGGAAAAGAAGTDAAKAAARETGKSMAKDNVKGAAKDIGKDAARGAADKASQPKKPGGDSGDAAKDDSWKQFGKDVSSSVQDAAKDGKAEFNPLDDDDRGGMTRARDNLRQRTGIDADKAAGAVVGGAAAAAATATGVGAVGAGAAASAGAAVGEGVSKASHAVNTKFVGMRKNVTIAVVALVIMGFMMMTNIVAMVTQQNNAQSQQEALLASQQSIQQQTESDVAAATCLVEQEYPFGHLYPSKYTNYATDMDAVAQEMSVPAYGTVIALSAAMYETNVDPDFQEGDRYGIFGFETGEDTGTPEELLDIAYSTRLFFERLAESENWDKSPLTDNAQRVLDSPYPDGYAPFEAASREMMRQADLSVEAGCEVFGSEFSCDPVDNIEGVGFVYSEDALELSRCLWANQQVRDITTDSTGKEITLSFASNPGFDLKEALDNPASPASTADDLSAESVVSWIAGSYLTFGIKEFTYLDQRVVIDRKAEDVFQISEARSPANDLEIVVYGNAGTGVVDSGAVVGGDGWVPPFQGSLRVSSEFGMRKSPTFGDYRLHAGTDFAAPTGTPLVAASGGVVERSFWSTTGGNILRINHGNGIVTQYLHMSAAKVGAMDAVQKGQVVGYSGNTGSSTTGPHLHYEVHINGSPSNPRTFFAAQGVDF